LGACSGDIDVEPAGTGNDSETDADTRASADAGTANPSTGPGADASDTAAPGCAADETCVLIPEGFVGPIALARNDVELPALGCQGAYPEPGFRLSNGIDSGDEASCTCACGPLVRTPQCEPPVLSAFDPALGCNEFPVLDAWDRLQRCGPLGSEPPAGAIYGIGPTPMDGECEAVLVDAQIPTASFATEWTVCMPAAPTTCDIGTCVPPAPPGFDELLCIYSADQTAECPEEFPSWVTGYTGLDDTRTCNDVCQCRTTGFCHWTAELGDCDSPGLLVEECTPGLDVAGVTHATFFGPTLGDPECTAKNGPKGPAGEVTETGATRLCCQLPPAPE